MSLLSTQNLLWLAIFWATFAKNGLLFVPTSVHTASPPFTELPTFLVLARSWKQHTTTKRLPPLIWNSNFCRATRKLKLAVTIFQYPKFFFSPKLSSKYWQQHCCRLTKGDVELEFFSLNIWPLWSCCKTFECVNVYEKSLEKLLSVSSDYCFWLNTWSNRNQSSTSKCKALRYKCDQIRRNFTNLAKIWNIFGNLLTAHWVISWNILLAIWEILWLLGKCLKWPNNDEIIYLSGHTVRYK